MIGMIHAQLSDILQCLTGGIAVVILLFVLICMRMLRDEDAKNFDRTPINWSLVKPAAADPNAMRVSKRVEDSEPTERFRNGLG